MYTVVSPENEEGDMTRWLVVGAFIFIPMVADAECAWLLWWEEQISSHSYRTPAAKLPGGVKGTHEEKTTWYIFGSYPTKTACAQQQASRIESVLKTWRKRKADAKVGDHTISHEPGTNVISKASTYVHQNTSHFSTTMRYLCLPDTVDPRAKR